MLIAVDLFSLSLSRSCSFSVLHTFVIVAAGRDVVMLIARGSVGQDPWGRPQREWGDAQEKSSQTGRHRIGQDTGHSTLNGTELNVTEPNQDQTRPRQTEQKRTELNTGQWSVLNVGQNFSPHTFHMNPYAKLSPPPPPLIPHNNNNDNPRAEPILCVC